MFISRRDSSDRGPSCPRSRFKPFMHKPACGAISQDDKVLRIVTNPLEKPKEIPIKDIDEKRETKVSLMPEGLLTTLSKDEILDLLAYITTGAEPEHAAFKK